MRVVVTDLLVFVGRRPQTLPRKEKVHAAAPLAVVCHHFMARRAVITTQAAVVKSAKSHFDHPSPQQRKE